MRLIQDKGRIRDAFCGAAPVIEEEFAEAGALDALQELFGDDLVGINVGAVKRGDLAGVGAKWLYVSLLSL